MFADLNILFLIQLVSTVACNGTPTPLVTMFLHDTLVTGAWDTCGLVVFHCTNKLKGQPIGLRKILIDYFFLPADQWDCTNSLSIFNHLASSEERFRTFLAKFVTYRFPTRGLRWPAKSFGVLVSHGKRPRPNYFLLVWIFSPHDSFLFRSTFFLRF